MQVNTPTLNLPTRVKGHHLDKCRTQSLVSNLFKIDFPENLVISIYAVKITPHIDFSNRNKMRKILTQSRMDIEKYVGSFVISGRNLFGTGHQRLGKSQQISLPANHQNQRYELSLKYVKSVAMQNIYDSNKHQSGPVFSFFNNMIKNFFYQLGYTEIGKSRKYFDSTSKISLPNAKIMVYHGYSTSFNLLENGLFLKIDPSMKIIRTQTLLETINQFYKRHEDKSKQQKRQLLEQQLINKQVMANYGKNRYYTIEAVLFDENVEQLKINIDGSCISLYNYYKQNYNIQIQSKKQPLIRAAPLKKDQPAILIPQLLLMSGLPDDFDERKRRDVSQQTIVKPQQKFYEIQKIMDKFNKQVEGFNPRAINQQLGINISHQAAKIQAKVLNPPHLQLGNQDKIEQNKASNFLLFNKKLFQCRTQLNIILLHSQDIDLPSINSLLKSTCFNLGIKYQIRANPINYADSKMALRKISDIIQQESGENTNMFWFIIPANFKHQYKNLKRMLLNSKIERNSQVTVSNTLQKKGFASILTKILLQMTAKIGNKLWVPKIPQKVHNSPIMLIAIESYSDSQLSHQSVVSYCCNINPQISEFYSNYYHIDSSQSNQLKMKKIIMQCISQYLVRNNAIPHDVIVLKNGTSKHDNQTLLASEIHEMLQTFKKVPKEFETPKLIYILLDKNPNQKFFLDKNRQLTNPISGTLINSGAVSKNYQFYLIAQHCNRGTVKPTFYRIIYSNSSLEEGILSEVIFTQCFNYMNWTGSIKIPAVMQYAKKLSIFAAQYINRENQNERLNRNLYFI